MTHPTTPTIRERIEAGAAWLDETEPEWRNAIDTRVLDLSHPNNCVLGQVFASQAAWYDIDTSGYDYIVGAHLEGAELAISRGFDADEESYADLTAAWQRYLTEGMW